MRAVSCAGHGSIKSILDDMKLLSTEAEGVNIAIPENDRPMLVNSAGRVGALLGLKSSEAGSSLCAHVVNGSTLTVHAHKSS